MEDLKPGMELQGTVRNVVDFGAFVDIGVKQDGMVHISKLSNRFVKHPSDVVAVGDIVTVWVDAIDLNKGRIALTMLPQAK
jgi:protein Tex